MKLEYILANDIYYVPMTEINKNSRDYNFRYCTKIKKIFFGIYLVEYTDRITGNFTRKFIYPAAIQEISYEQTN